MVLEKILDKYKKHMLPPKLSFLEPLVKRETASHAS